MAARRRSRLPATLDGIGEDLRAAAREAGLRGAARLAFCSSFEAADAGCRDEDPKMTAPSSPPTEPDASARICPGDQTVPCAACHRP
ncbi:hypothetical protein ABZ841_39720, partial [Streptomyces flaveolus]